MTREEFDNLYAMVTSENLDDVHLGMELLNSIRIPAHLYYFLWIESSCTQNELVDWGLYNEMAIKRDECNISMELVLNSTVDQIFNYAK